MRRLAVLLSLSLGIFRPAAARADSDGYYCIGPNYIAYQFGIVGRPPGVHRLFVVRLGGPLGIGAPASLALPHFQVQAMLCTDRGVRMLGNDSIYTVQLDTAKSPARYAAVSVPPGAPPSEFAGQWANLGLSNRAVNELEIDRVLLFTDTSGHTFTLEVSPDSTAARLCDPDVRARIVEASASGAQVRERVLPRGTVVGPGCEEGPAYSPLPYVDPPRAVSAGVTQMESARTADGGDVCFDVPSGFVNWQALAVATLGAGGAANPSRDTLRAHYESMFRTSTLHFAARVTRPTADVRWLIIHEDGVLALVPSELRGEVSFQLNRGLRILGSPRYSGAACAHATGAPIRAAFAVSSRAAGAWASETVKADSLGAGAYSVAVGGWRYRFSRDPGSGNVKKTIVVRGPNGPVFLLVVWPEESTCLNTYSLFEIAPGGTLRELRQNTYNCDV